MPLPELFSVAGLAAVERAADAAEPGEGFFGRLGEVTFGDGGRFVAADQVSQARAVLGRVLADCRMADDGVLICSELATNAVLHSESARPGGQFTVRAEVREGDYVWLEVEVEDQGGRWAENESSDLRGRGLEIVVELADYWDVRGDDTARVVCARSPPPCLLVGALRQSLAMDMTPTDLDISVRPANEAPWEDVERVLGKARCHGAQCYCQRFKTGWSAWRATTDEERAHRLREQTDCGHPESGSTSGLLAYADGEPVGWCNVEPRTAFPYIPDARIAWKKRGEDKDDDSVRAAACFITRTEFRHSGVSRALAAAAVDFARERGARALEGYAMITEPGKEITWGELHVGSRSIFAAAGFREVARPTLRRVVMRIDF